MSIVQCYKTTAPIQGVLTLITEQSFLDKRIRVFGTPEDPLFLARDVAEWIDYSKKQDGSRVSGAGLIQERRSS